MKRFLIIIISIVVTLVIAVSVMFAFNICPPAGPWPTPPWCANVLVDEERGSTSTLKDESTATTDTLTNPTNVEQKNHIYSSGKRWVGYYN